MKNNTETKEYKIQKIFGNLPPREKLIKYGSNELTDSELLSIVFVTGTRYESVVEISEKIMNKYRSAHIREMRNVRQISESFGIGESKSCQLIAMLELGRRFYEVKEESQLKLRSPSDVMEYNLDMKKLKKEELRGIFLNSNNVVLKQELLSLGNGNTNIITPKEILYSAIQSYASGIILIHNHPSGNPKPSNEDREFTSKISQGAKIIGVELLDHLIISSNGYFSFREEGEL